MQHIKAAACLNAEVLAKFATGRLGFRGALFASAALTFVSSPALADCVPDTTGLVVTCSGTSAAYTNTGAGLGVAVASGAAITAPLVIGDNGALTNAGAVSGTTAIGSVQFGKNATIVNNGTITSTAATAGSAAITTADFGTVTNNGTLTAAAGTPAVQFGQGGSFINSALAPVAVTGNIVFGMSAGGITSSFSNANTAFGLTGSVVAGGNINLDNAGLWTGNLAQTQGTTIGTVNFTNEAVGTFTGAINTGDPTTVMNNGTMTLTSGSMIGASVLAPSNFTNNGTLNVGVATTAATTTTPLVLSASTPMVLTVNGAFVQGANGVLNIGLKPTGTAAALAGTNYGQVFAASTANLSGTVNLVVAPGFYANGSTYNVVLSNQAMNANVTTTGNNLTFISFKPNGVVPLASGQQALQYQVQRTTTYAAGIAAVATPSQTTIATAMQPLATYADANPGSTVASFIGDMDVLNVTQAQALLDGLSPVGYLAYANALRDQANAFSRQISLRMADQNSDHDEDGWWGSMMGQVDASANTGNATKDKMWGINLGYDYSGPHHVLGFAANISGDSLTYAPGTMSGHNMVYALATYGGWQLGPLHLTGQFAYDFGHMSANKTITAGTVVSTANGHSGEHLFKATSTAGFLLKAAGMQVEPFVGIDYMKGKISGFTEAGAGGADLTVNPISADRTDLLAGLSVTRAEGTWRPYLRATWRSEIGNGPDSSVTAFFNGDTTTSFTLAGVPAAKQELDANIGMNIVFDDAGSLFFGYQGTMRSGYSSHGINAGLRIEF